MPQQTDLFGQQTALSPQKSNATRHEFCTRKESCTHKEFLHTRDFTAARNKNTARSSEAPFARFANEYHRNQMPDDMKRSVQGNIS
mgnify:CR=1 FL=1